MAGEVVRIRNVGKEDFVDMYGNQPYRIRAGSESIVPFDAMALWLGHPAANNVDPRNRVRVSEYARLRTRYGAYDNPDLWEQNKPKLECFTIDTGEPIITVVDDPDGDTLVPESVPGSDQAFILARMKQMEEEMAALRNALQVEQNAAAAERMGIAQPDTPAPHEIFQPATTPTPDVPGTIPAADDAAAREATGTGQVVTKIVAPRPPARTKVGEDTPTRVTVGQG